jgi:hypothetical protein
VDVSLPPDPPPPSSLALQAAVLPSAQRTTAPIKHRLVKILSLSGKERTAAQENFAESDTKISSNKPLVLKNCSPGENTLTALVHDSPAPSATRMLRVLATSAARSLKQWATQDMFAFVIVDDISACPDWQR